MARMNSWTIIVMIFIVGIFGTVMNVSTVRADTSATITWIAAGNGYWSTAGNWNLSRVPAAGDHVIIPAGVTVTFSNGTYDIGSIDCSGTLFLSGGTLNINDTTTVSTVNNLNMNARYANLGVKGNLALTGTGNTWSGGYLVGTGTTTVQEGAVLSLLGGEYKEFNSTIENKGTLILSGDHFRYDYSATINNSGMFDIQGDWSFAPYVGSAVINNNAGAILKKSSGTGTAIIYAAVTNNGTVLVGENCGILSMVGGGTSNGSFDANSGSALSFGGTTTLNASSSVTIPVPGILTVTSGPVTFNCGNMSVGTINVAGGTANFNSSSMMPDSIKVTGGIANFNAPTDGMILSSLNIAGGEAYFNIPATIGTLNLSSRYSKLGVKGNLTLTGTGNTWSGGYLVGTGTTTVQEGAVLSLLGGEYKEFNSTIENKGTFILSGDHFRYDYSATINNSGMFDIQGDWSFAPYVGSAVINNNAGAILKKSSGTGTAIIYAAVNNNGTVLVRENCGTLNLAGGGNSSGSYQANSGTALAFGSTTLNASSSITVPGTLTINSGASVNFNGGSVNIGTINVAGGTANFNGPAAGVNLGVFNVSGAAYFNIPAAITTLNLSGTLGGSGKVTVTGTGNTWSSGSMVGTGTTTVQAGAVLSMIGSSYKELSRTIENNGTLILSGDHFRYDVSGTTINNNGMFDIQGDWSFAPYVGSAVINNNAGATLKKSSGTGTAIIYAALNNKGMVLNGTHGSIKIANNYTQDSSGVLRFDIGGAAQGTDYNQLQVTGQAVVNGGCVDVNLLPM